MLGKHNAGLFNFRKRKWLIPRCWETNLLLPDNTTAAVWNKI